MCDKVLALGNVKLKNHILFNEDAAVHDNPSHDTGPG